MAYPEALTAALGGVTIHQLRNWRARAMPLLIPETHTQRPVRYSFRDLIAIRTFAALRTEFSLQSIRKAVANLQTLADVEHLSKCKLVGDGKTIVWVTEKGNVDILKRPGQQVLITMRDVLGEFCGWTGATVVPLHRPKRGVEVDPHRLGGFPVIEQTRIPYDIIASLASDGLGAKDIRHFYPSVTGTGVSGAIAFDNYVLEYNGRLAA